MVTRTPQRPSIFLFWGNTDHFKFWPKFSPATLFDFYLRGNTDSTDILCTDELPFKKQRWASLMSVPITVWHINLEDKIFSDFEHKHCLRGAFCFCHHVKAGLCWLKGLSYFGRSLSHQCCPQKQLCLLHFLWWQTFNLLATTSYRYIKHTYNVKRSTLHNGVLTFI